MGGTMGGASMGAWILLWIFLGLAIVVAGVLIARALGTRREPERPKIPPGESPAVRDAKDSLKLRYAHGEISREEYLQGKIELED